MRKLENLLDESTEGESGNMEKNVTQEEIAAQEDSTIVAGNLFFQKKVFQKSA
jgi:hypothetical protein